MPSGHNSRSKAKKVAAKDRKADRYSHKNRSSGASHHRGGQHSSYLNPFAAKRMNQKGNIDPLDQQLFDYIIVVDVEATCDRDRDHYPNEVIELPAVLIDVRKGLVDRDRSFQTYIKPWRNPILTDFCKELTGITQEQVDNAPDISTAIQLFLDWYHKTIPKGAKCAFASDGPWDFKNFIHERHVLRDHVSFPSIFYEYMDIRTTFSRQFNQGTPIKLDAMLRRMQLRFEGRPHCGFDDAYNIARLCVAMMKQGCIFDFLCAIPLEDKFHYHLEGIPLYRREEGSGRLDRDVVDDIAKSCFGEDYFQFGEQHADDVQNYRNEFPHLFKNKNVVSLKRRAERRSRRDWVKWLSRVLPILCVVLLCLCVFVFQHKIRK
ncbi:hypothetical protein AGDE_04822 [Angomonas deanei]|uniref:Exonuclease, putative n=1 Tax=Angomonas deanei TaxID=59799 RepID=S9WF51_9TRYP|nr:hypothetical protein AGDE_11130 [Angomonas deanei]EPY32457.1 hypothetical protein AGDE_08676 [Angomonas deanei]EPY37806.1 hypothetical protein AGDE_06128 [Angomonas deanei]EPY39107.1 hypothetical protein AGDE_04822 [Angomonas deanei]CAD2213389.1 Exonuclease, putative [Angomonas deanei]|eukprot:EPY26712.1 hypothetical protein AGDE_11130 [Angomonas deanei]